MSKPKSIYIVAQYYARPKKPANTRFPGYMSDPDNVAWDEKVDVTYGLKTKDLLNSKVILNITEQKIEKNSFKVDKSFMELFSYFYSSNPNQIARALQQFGITVGTDKDESVQEDVSQEAETSSGSEPASAADAAITS